MKGDHIVQMVDEIDAFFQARALRKRLRKPTAKELRSAIITLNLCETDSQADYVAIIRVIDLLERKLGEGIG